MIQVVKNLETAFEKRDASSARAVAMAMERCAVNANYEKLRSSMEQRVGFANNEIDRFKAENVTLTLESDASVAKAEQVSLETQRVPWLVEEAKKLRERVSSLETTTRAMALKGGKSLATRRKRQKTDVAAEVEEARVKLGDWYACVA